MDWAGLALALAKFFQGFANAEKTPEPPVPTPVDVVTHAKRSAAIQQLQEFLNQANRQGIIHFDPPLVVDGWLGPKTEAAIMLGVARLKELVAANA